MPAASEQLRDESLVLNLCPDYGSPWGLWSDHPPVPFSDPATIAQLGPDNFGFNNEIRAALQEWLDVWRDNFADSPYEHTWKYSFDVCGWIDEGDRISRMIEKSLPAYKIEKGYRSYAQSPIRAADA